MANDEIRMTNDGGEGKAAPDARIHFEFFGPRQDITSAAVRGSAAPRMRAAALA